MIVYLINSDFSRKIADETLLKFKKKEINDLLKQRIHCFTYFVLDKILQKYHKIIDTELIFVNKKPYLRNMVKFISISHSDKYIAIAISDYNCGIDIEKVKERNYLKISERFGFQSDSLENFYENWTHFEAKYKLNSVEKKRKTWSFENFVITALSENSSEKIEIIVQNLNDFSNLVI